MFALTQFNEGCVCFCVLKSVCFCARVFPRRVHIGRDGRTDEGWMEVFIISSSQVSSFTICRACVCVCVCVCV